MRKLVVSELLTLDGVMEAPGGEAGHPHTGWAGELIGPEEVAWKEQEAMDAGALLLGRVTYESFAGAWPHRLGAFADRMNALPKHVVSTTLGEPDWHNSTLLAGELAGAVADLKAGAGGPILVMGSRMLVHALARLDLVDEYRIMLFPVLVGSGRRLFPDSPDKIPLRLVDLRAFASGISMQVFERDRG
ncbi:pyrimidine reductase [Allostella vacuolata]|nr:pyrimidine reductase [Stella vacuolata]